MQILFGFLIIGLSICANFDVPCAQAGVGPSVVSTSPANGATGVTVSLDTITITFNKEMSSSTAFNTYRFGESVNHWSTDKRTYYITRVDNSTPLPVGTQIDVILNSSENPNGFQDTDGNLLDRYAFSFFIEATTPTNYRMEYYLRNVSGAAYIWMPIPSCWDGRGVSFVEIEQIAPTPTNIYRDINGNQIAYWETSQSVGELFKIVFLTELSSIIHEDLDHSWPPYDPDSEAYINNTSPTPFVQSTDPLVVAKAMEIIDGETNPYRIAKLFHQWVSTNITYGVSSEMDAKSTLERGWGQCGDCSNLFVAFCRSTGIPARNVSGLHPTLFEGSFNDGALCMKSEEGLGTHVWAEFYLEGHGWVQCDPTASSMFSAISGERIITSKGTQIEISANSFSWEPFWFHIPIVSNGSASYTQEVTEGALCLSIEKLPSINTISRIRANGCKGSVVASRNNPILIEISLSPEDRESQMADWWVAARTTFDPPGDWYSFVYPTGWAIGINLCIQNPLFNLSAFEVLNTTLPAGNYTFYFAIDDPDGEATGPWWGIDSVEVQVQ